MLWWFTYIVRSSGRARGIDALHTHPMASKLVRMSGEACVAKSGTAVLRVVHGSTSRSLVFSTWWFD